VSCEAYLVLANLSDCRQASDLFSQGRFCTVLPFRSLFSQTPRGLTFPLLDCSPDPLPVSRVPSEDIPCLKLQNSSSFPLRGLVSSALPSQLYRCCLVLSFFSFGGVFRIHLPARKFLTFSLPVAVGSCLFFSPGNIFFFPTLFFWLTFPLLLSDVSLHFRGPPLAIFPPPHRTDSLVLSSF